MLSRVKNNSPGTGVLPSSPAVPPPPSPATTIELGVVMRFWRGLMPPKPVPSSNEALSPPRSGVFPDVRMARLRASCREDDDAVQKLHGWRERSISSFTSINRRKFLQFLAHSTPLTQSTVRYMQDFSRWTCKRPRITVFYTIWKGGGREGRSVSEHYTIFKIFLSRLGNPFEIFPPLPFNRQLCFPPLTTLYHGGNARSW